MLADPAEELLEFPPQGGVVLTGLGLTRAALQALWEQRGRREGGRCRGGGGETKERGQRKEEVREEEEERTASRL